MDIEDRIKYYLGNLYNIFITNQQIEYKDIFNEKEVISYNKIQLINNDKLFNDNYDTKVKYYINDLRKYFINSEIKNFNIYIAFGDVNVKMKKYCFTKSRPIDLTNNFNILLNLNTPRHWGGLDNVKKYDIPFDKKNNKIIWRGASTGNKRVKFVMQMLSHYKFRQHLKNKCNEYGCEMIVVTEEYTSKTCTNCGKIENNFRKREK
jgi:hypothetical protein